MSRAEKIEYNISLSITGILAYISWNFIEVVLEKQVNNKFIVLLIGLIFPLGVFNILLAVCKRLVCIPLIKKIIYGKEYFEGSWISFYYIYGKLRFSIDILKQNEEGITGVGTEYLFDLNDIKRLDKKNQTLYYNIFDKFIKKFANKKDDSKPDELGELVAVPTNGEKSINISDRWLHLKPRMINDKYEYGNVLFLSANYKDGFIYAAYQDACQRRDSSTHGYSQTQVIERGRFGIPTKKRGTFFELGMVSGILSRDYRIPTEYAKDLEKFFKSDLFEEYKIEAIRHLSSGGTNEIIFPEGVPVNKYGELV